MAGQATDLLPRIVYRTHYQAVGQELLLLAVEVLSATASISKEIAAELISKAAKERDLKFNSAAAAYLLDECKAIGICDQNYRLSADASGMKVAIPAPLEASKWFLLRTFLLGDGAFLVELSRTLEEKPRSLAELYHEPVLEGILSDIYSFYIGFSPDVYDKSTIRLERDKLTTSDGRVRSALKWKTRKHKILFHLTALCDFGFVETTRMSDEADAVTYSLTALGMKFLAAFSDLQALEARCANTDSLEAALMSILDLDAKDVSSNEIRQSYADLVNLGIPLVPTEALYVALNMRGIGEAGTVVRKGNLDAVLSSMRKSDTSRVHIYAIGDADIGAIQIDLPL
jgi:hypothetical protein